MFVKAMITHRLNCVNCQWMRQFLYTFLLICLYPYYSPAHDTSIYCLKKFAWVSTCYHFYKQNSTVKSGTFEKIMESDDGQRWHGTGKYVESKKKLTLYSYVIVRTKYDISGDSLVINPFIHDSSKIKNQKIYKTGDELYEWTKRKDGSRVRVFYTKQ